MKMRMTTCTHATVTVAVVIFAVALAIGALVLESYLVDLVEACLDYP